MPNAKVLESKKAIVAELTEKLQNAAGSLLHARGEPPKKLQNAASGVLVDYKGITVAEDTALRVELRKNDVEYAVVKNTLTRFAAKNAGFGELSDSLNGTTSLALSHSDPIAPMRVINKFAKQFNGAKFTRPALWTARFFPWTRSWPSPSCPPRKCSRPRSWVPCWLPSPAWLSS